MKFLPPDQVPPGMLERLHAQGNVALAILEDHLSRTEFLCGSYSIADIACYPYTMLCGEAGFDLEIYPSVSEMVRERRGNFELHCFCRLVPGVFYGKRSKALFWNCLREPTARLPLREPE